MFRARRRWSSKRPDEKSGRHGSDNGRGLFHVIRLLVIVLFAILSVQLVRLQIISGDEYRERAETNTLREVQTPSARGLIYDREDRSLVLNDASFAVALIPADLSVEEGLNTYQILGPLLAMTAMEIEGKVQEHLTRESSVTPVVIKEDLDDETVLVLSELEPVLPGLQIVRDPTRHYPAGELTSHVLGYVGELSPEEYQELADEGYLVKDRIGKTGIELVYEDLLRGEPGRRLLEVDAQGRELNLISERGSVDGSNLLLTIDLELQNEVAGILEEAASSSDSAAAVVMDLKNGEILAMVSLPTLDNNIFSGPISAQELATIVDDPGKPLLNHAISGMYQPGSTFKTIVAAAALQEGIASADTVINSRGYITVESEFDPNVVDIFRDRAALGPLNFYGGLAMSSDIYYYYLSGGKADEAFVGLGEDRVARYARAFGLGEPTGVDLPIESAGLVPDPSWKEETIGESWFIGDTYNFGIGQGYLATTPIQMLVAVAAIGNGGDVLVPHLLKEVRDSDGNVVREVEREVRQRVPVERNHLDIVARAMLQSVVAGTASSAQVRGLSVAGKTGTAEFGQLRPDDTYGTHGWFVGYAPYDDPQVAVVVFVQQGEGETQAAPAAGQILDYLFNGSGSSLVRELQEGRSQ